MYGTTAQTALGSWSIVVKSLGTLATPTVSPAAGAIANGATITFSSTDTGVVFAHTTNGTDPTYTSGTTGSTATFGGTTTTYEFITRKAGYPTSALNSVTYTLAGGGGATATDTFQALGSGVLLSSGGNWAGVGTNQMITSNEAGDIVAYGNDGSGASARYTATTFAANHSAAITLYLSGSPSGGIAPAVRMQPAANSFYFAYYDETAQLVYLYKRNAGTDAQIGSTASRNYASGDVLTLSATGTGSATRLTVTDGSGAVFTSVDPGGTYLDDGQPGIWGYGTNAGISASSWTGADL